MTSVDQSGGPDRTYLTVGPVLFNWPASTWRDFYCRLADEAPVDIVYLGETVCSKRQPFFADVMVDVIERLTAAGKEIVLSTLALSMTSREVAGIYANVAGPFPVEVNDMTGLAAAAGRPHVIGPHFSTYNEHTIRDLAKHGACRVTLPVELDSSAIRVLAKSNIPLEVQVFGRAPLAISARCYHARAEGLHKDGCRFVCDKDPDGLPVLTLDGKPFLAVNGLQTLSHACVNLAAHIPELVGMGVRHFRISPHSMDMMTVVRLYRNLLDETISVDEFNAALPRFPGEAEYADGYFRGKPGITAIGA